MNRANKIHALDLPVPGTLIAVETRDLEDYPKFRLLQKI